MHRLALVAAVVLALGCNASSAPGAPAALQGTWAEDIVIPGSSVIVTLADHAGTISGRGTYAIEAGRSGTLTVTGSYLAPNVTLTVLYDYGYRWTFAGTVRDDQHMSGMANGSTRSFTRR